MLHYRFYTLRSDRSIEAGQVVESPDDIGALEQARRMMNGKDIEAWQGARKVFVLTHDAEF